MVKRVFRIAAVSVALFAFGAAPALAAGVQALFDLARSNCAFPEHRFAVPDHSQNTGLARQPPSRPDAPRNPSTALTST